MATTPHKVLPQTVMPAQCADWVGRIASPNSFAEAIGPYSKLNLEKDEFETTDAYKARVSAGIENAPPVLVIDGPEPGGARTSALFEDPIVYDADRRVLSIRRNALDNYDCCLIPGLEMVIDDLDLWGKFGFDYDFMKVSIELSDSSVVTGTYEATNAFGSVVTVKKQHRTVTGVFDRTLSFDDPLRSSSYATTVITGILPLTKKVLTELQMPPEEARRLKRDLSVTYVIKPHSPFLGKTRHIANTATLTHPNDIVQDTIVLFADIQCALLLDGMNKVIASFPTN